MKRELSRGIVLRDFTVGHMRHRTVPRGSRVWIQRLNDQDLVVIVNDRLDLIGNGFLLGAIVGEHNVRPLSPLEELAECAE